MSAPRKPTAKTKRTDDAQDTDGVLPDLQKGDALKLLGARSAPAFHPTAAALHPGFVDQRAG